MVFNNNTEYLLAFISALLGLSVPLMLQAIERVDDKYKSSRIAERLKHEPVIRFCGGALVLSILTCTYAIFVKIPSPWDCWVMNHSADLIALVSCLLLIAFFVFSCLKVLKYYNQEQLQEDIIKSIEKAGDNVSRRESAILDLVDLSKTTLESSDRKPAFRVYDVLCQEVNRSVELAGVGGMQIPQYLTYGITSINENLCLMERRPYSINNGNQLLKMLISSPTKISEDTYRLLWKNLLLQLYYNADDWVYEYWSAAVQTCDFGLQRIFVGYYGGSQEGQYSQEMVDLRLTQRQRFLEFHVVLCAYILHLKRYDLLNKLFWYTRVYPPQYPLIPSSLTEIISVFKQVDESERFDISVENYYPFLGMKGIVEGEIQGLVKSYLSLLYLRIFSPIGIVPDVSLSLPDEIGPLKAYKSYLDFIERRMTVIQETTELYALVKIKDNAPQDTINQIKKGIDQKIETIRVRGELDAVLAEENKEELHNLVVNKLKPYGVFIDRESKFTPDVNYWINGNVSYPYDNAAFMKNAGISYMGMAETVGASTIGHFQYFFATVFYQVSKGMHYRINSAELFDAISRLQITDSHIIVAFDIYWDYYISLKQTGLSKDKEGKYSYNGINIINLPSGSFPLVSQSLFILRIEDLPKVVFTTPNAEAIERYKLLLIDEKYQLYSSIVQLSQDPELLEFVQKELPEAELKDKALFSSFMQANMLWSKHIPILGIKVMYDLSDNGTSDKVDSVKSFNDICVKNGGVRAEDLAAYQLGRELGIKLTPYNNYADFMGEKEGKKVFVETKYNTEIDNGFIQEVESIYGHLQESEDSFDLYAVVVTDLPIELDRKKVIEERIKEINENIIMRFYSFYKR